MRRFVRRLLTTAAIALGALGAAGCAAEAPPRAVHVLEASGEVDGVLARYLARGIEAAEEQQAAAVLVRLDTPGGSLEEMRAAVAEIEQARVPVIVWVGPAGARAASAGTFIVMAAHVAAMAPGTNIGAATPVTVGGGDVPGALGRKVENDVAALARGVAELRGRNAAWAELAVREAAAASASEAVELRVVDYVAADLDAVLAQAEGREVALPGGVSSRLAVASAPRVEVPLNAYERTLRLLGRPLVALTLFTLGGALLWMELNAPGMFVPGALGLLLLIGALLGLGMLVPQEAAGAALLVGLVLLGLEVFVPGGILGSIGAIAILLALAVFAAGSTAIDLRLALTAAAIAVAAAGLVMGIAFGLIARRYVGPAERSDSVRL